MDISDQLQREMLRNSLEEDEILLALAGLKQVNSSFQYLQKFDPVKLHCIVTLYLSTFHLKSELLSFSVFLKFDINFHFVSLFATSLIFFSRIESSCMWLVFRVKPVQVSSKPNSRK